MAWIERVNTQRHIECFVSESFLRLRLQYDDYSTLNWMRIFNSKMDLSDEFIVANISHIKWNWLFRPLSESIIDRFANQVIQWNAQLYTKPRTIEFLVRYHARFDWKGISNSPPLWFTDLHFELFGSSMHWEALTKHINKMSLSLISRFADKLDWEWITKYGIRDESFGQRFVSYIIWKHPCLDTHALSTEFLYEVYLLRKSSYEMIDRSVVFISPTKKVIAALSDYLADGFDPTDKLPIGATITTTFAIQHHEELDWREMNRRGMITHEIAMQLPHLTDIDDSTTLGSTEDMVYH